MRRSITLAMVLAILLGILAPGVAQPEKAGSVHRVIVVDVCESISHSLTSELYRATAGARAEDLFTVIQLAAPPRVVVEGTIGEKAVLEAARGVVKKANGDLLATLALVESKLKAAAPRAARQEVHVLTDLHRPTWTAGNAATITQVLRRIDALADVTIVDVADDADHTDAPAVGTIVLGVAVDPIPARTRQPVTLTATLLHLGPEPTRAVVKFGALGIGKAMREQARIAVPDAIGQQVVELQPGQQTPVVLKHTFTAEDDYAVEMRVEDSSKLRPLQGGAVLRVRDALRVQIVSDAPAREAADLTHPAAAIKIALSVGGPMGSGFHVESLTTQQFLDDAGDPDCVILAGVRRPSAKLAEQVERILALGGGVWWFLAADGDAQAIEQHLYRNGQGPLPATVGPLVERGPMAAELATNDPELVRLFQLSVEKNQPASLSVAVHRYVPIRAADKSGGRVRLSLIDGANGKVLGPALVEWQRGAGRLLVSAVEATFDGTRWPVMPSFPVMIISQTERAAAARFAPRSVLVDQEVAFAVSDRDRGDLPLVVLRPEAPPAGHPANLPPGVTLARAPGRATPGLTGLTLARGGAVIPYVVNATAPKSATEGQPSRLQPWELRRRFPGWEAPILRGQRRQSILERFFKK